MKINLSKINLCLVLAALIILFVTCSLALASGRVPSTAAAILMVVILVLGIAAGRWASRAELERMASIEAGRRIQVNCMAASRNRMEEDIEQLREMQLVVRDTGDFHAA